MNRRDPAQTLFASAALRRLDATSRQRVEEAGRTERASAGAVLYAAGQDADTSFVVLHGEVELWAQGRGDTAPVRMRSVQAGDTFGEEGTLGLPRMHEARCPAGATVFRVSSSLLERAHARSGKADAARVERRRLVRAVTADLLRTMPLARGLPPADFEMLLDAADMCRVARGEPVYVEGDQARDAFLVVHGLLQLQRDEPGGVAIVAYLRCGDLFGEWEALAATTRPLTAAVLGDGAVLRFPKAVLRSVFDRHPGLRERVARLTHDRSLEQQAAVAQAGPTQTQHVFSDLYRMQMARSLLVIDQDTCVRCGHCAWSCAATHDDGVARLVRRGDKVLARIGDLASAQRSLLVPTSCQHCKNPACMVDCPTAAIRRSAEGNVEINPALCTGCGACAKACPWDNISIAPRHPTEGSVFSLVAVKCDLCSGHEGPACVQACPTGSLVRLDPQREVAEVGLLLGGAEAPHRAPTARVSPSPLARQVAVASTASVLVGLGVVGAVLRVQGTWHAGSGAGWIAGWVALAATVGSFAYAVPKRFPRLWHRRRRRGRRASSTARPAVRSRLVSLRQMHILFGSVALAGALGHGGLVFSAGAGVLDALFLGACLLGFVGTALYAWVPQRLSAIESEGLLPEDLRGREPELRDRLMRDISGADEATKHAVAKLLLPYARSWGGGLRIVMRRRSLAEERAALQARMVAVLGPDRVREMQALPAAIRTVVLLRVAGARHLLTVLLRVWLVPHIVVSVAATALLLAHVTSMLFWGGSR